MSDFFKGLKAVLSLLIGIIPFGLICGITSVNSNLSTAQSIGMSFFIFAGSAQMALANLVFHNSQLITIIATVALINLRMAMYSASLSEHFQNEPLYKKIIASYLLTDQAYAVSISEFIKNDKIDKINYYIGTALTIWITWQISLTIGVFVGKTIPANLSLEFAIPLTFLAVITPFLKNKFFIITAITTGIIIIFTKNMPYNIGFFLAVFTGIFVGIFVKHRTIK
jgi:predicted branched-subunit amino acid permease